MSEKSDKDRQDEPSYPLEFVDMVSGYGFLVLHTYLEARAPEAVPLLDGLYDLVLGCQALAAGQTHKGTLMVIEDGLPLVTSQVMKLGGNWQFIAPEDG